MKKKLNIEFTELSEIKKKKSPKLDPCPCGDCNCGGNCGPGDCNCNCPNNCSGS